MDKTYRIKPLVWVNLGGDIWDAKTPGVNFRVMSYQDVFEVWISGESAGSMLNCDSIADGKAKCEAHRLARCMEFLEVVE